MRRHRLIAALCMSLSLTAACATENGDTGGDRHVETAAPARGLAYARDVCASCHGVELGQIASPVAAAPSFQALADRPDMNRAVLAALLRTPHRTMPNLIVEPDRIDDLSAYLSTLRTGE